MQTCWKCSEEVPSGSTACPHCKAPVGKGTVDQMATIGPGGAPSSQIVAGVVVNDRYEIQREIGRGGMGIVYLAHDRMMAAHVALKVIPQELCLDPNAIASLKRETAIALKLTDKNIVRLHTLDTWEGQAFVVMEYVGGGTLAHLRAKFGGTCSLEEGLPYFKQIASALDYSHSSSPAVIHRDLKPLNILLTEDGIVKIADYGLARVLRDSASRVSGGDSAGTLAYMAPEQIRGKGIGKGSDIYAFAAIIYEMLSGNPPFYTGDLRWQILHEEVEPIPAQSDHVNAALLAGLDKDRDERPETAAELIALLLGEKQVSGVKRKKKKKTVRKKRGSSGETTGLGKTFFGVFLLLLIAGLAVGGYYYSGEVKQLVRGGPILSVESDPAGAMLYVDGGEVNATPTVVDNLPDGTHVVRIKKELYLDYEKKIFIQQSDPVHLQAVLIPEPFGDLQVESNPSGATILVDGKERGTTPVILNHLDKGKRLLQLERDGFDSWQQQVEIVPLNAAEVLANLISSYGGLEVESEPPGATVLLDGKQVGSTPYTSDKVRKGDHTLELKLERYDAWKKQVSIFSSQTVKEKANLISSYGLLSVISTPSGATVLFNNKKIGKTPLEQVEVPKGAGRLELQKANHKNRLIAVEIILAKPSVIYGDLELAMGKLKITSSPSGATVKVAGKSVGKTPVELELLQGKSQVEVVSPTYSVWKKQVVVSAGETHNIKATLERARQLKDATTGMEFMLVPGGCFQMGDTFGDGTSDEKPAHEACVDGYYIGKYEVTQGEYTKIIGSNPSKFKKGDRYPVEKVSWEDAQTFISKLNSRSGKKYHLPTEAEWEYAARSGGKKEKYSGSNDPSAVAWYNSNSGSSTHKVGTKSPNGLGIYDMSGNVWEWVGDWYDESYYGKSPRNNPAGPASGVIRVNRGGGWNYNPADVRSAGRRRYEPWNRYSIIGFRLVSPFPGQ